MLRVLGKSSSINVRKVLWTCAEIGIPYEQEQWGEGALQTNTPNFLRLNPNGTVPVIQDGDLILWESNSICRYLAGKHRREDLLPINATERAKVEQWMDWQATDLNNAWRYAFMALVRHSDKHQDRLEVAMSEAQWNRQMRILDSRLSTSGAYVNGTTLTLADIVLGVSVHRWYSTPMNRPRLPAIEVYYECLSEREGFVRHVRNGHP